ncbi:hypothetical protein EI94DRAFT_1723708 [Lactarius quietus]|nr:hypothetical protein EI94DRAFT_1723708 [Lactarius quietus]
MRGIYFPFLCYPAFSRICVFCVVLDPKIPIYVTFTSPFSSDHSMVVPIPRPLQVMAPTCHCWDGVILAVDTGQ